MMLPLVIYYCCVSIYSGMMAVLGFDITTLPFWIGLILIITAHLSGRYIGRYDP